MKPAYGPEGWRKLIVSSLAIFCVTVLALKGVLSQLAAATIIALAGAYITGNVMSKGKAKD